MSVITNNTHNFFNIIPIPVRAKPEIQRIPEEVNKPESFFKSELAKVSVTYPFGSAPEICYFDDHIGSIPLKEISSYNGDSIDIDVVSSSIDCGSTDSPLLILSSKGRSFLSNYFEISNSYARGRLNMCSLINDIETPFIIADLENKLEKSFEDLKFNYDECEEKITKDRKNRLEYYEEFELKINTKMKVIVEELRKIGISDVKLFYHNTIHGPKKAWPNFDSDEDESDMIDNIFTSPSELILRPSSELDKTEVTYINNDHSIVIKGVISTPEDIDWSDIILKSELSVKAHKDILKMYILRDYIKKQDPNIEHMVS